MITHVLRPFGLCPGWWRSSTSIHPFSSPAFLCRLTSSWLLSAVVTEWDVGYTLDRSSVHDRAPTNIFSLHILFVFICVYLMCARSNTFSEGNPDWKSELNIDHHSFAPLSPPSAGGDRRSRGIGRELGAPSPPFKTHTLRPPLHHSIRTHPYPHPNPIFSPPSSYVCKRSHGNCRTACLATSCILSLGKNEGGRISEWGGRGGFQIYLFICVLMGVWGSYCNSSMLQWIH